ncbi:MAG: hypothetical protein KF862_09635 [Chitinophagaceae bacterium]|nr:hypothetical protein [Chitinophagaceae bacterium]
MDEIINKILRYLQYLLAETEKKVAQIQNRESGGNIIEDLSLKEFADYFDATISAIRSDIHLVGNLENVMTEFEKLLLIDISGVIKKRPFNVFAIFNSYLEGGRTELSMERFNNKILETIKSIEAYCKNLIYFLKVQV